MIKIRRALLSVSDKTGLVDLAKTLVAHGCELISTGGTGKALREAGLPVTGISKVSGNPEAFGGRMKTISFNVESALLFDRERDREEAAGLGIEPIDMVVCNLYPFGEYRDQGADTEVLLEKIDIGGPTMIRAAAKNHRYVAAVTRVDEYQAVREELDANGGSLGPDTRARLMRTAFNHTADYDAMIAETMCERAGERTLRLAWEGGAGLRYGENSHQEAWFLRQRGAKGSLRDAEVLNGGALSYNNVVDLHSALESVRDLEGIGCAVIKHNNPCGLGQGKDQRRVLEAAWEGDPISAFGSVVAFNKPVEPGTVEYFELTSKDKSRRKFVDVLVAPGFQDGALELLQNHKSLRVVRFDPSDLTEEWKVKVGGDYCLLQSPDRKLYDKLEVATERGPEKEDRELYEFGIKAVRQLKSNAIVVVHRLEDGTLQLLGMGCGQPNRVISTYLAVAKCRVNLIRELGGDGGLSEELFQERMSRAVLVSDAFFPFPDSIEQCAASGVRTVIEPGGSIRDKQVVEKCNELGLALMMTGTRHFNH